MRRRDFITLICGAAATRPLAVRAQQAHRVPRVGVLMSQGENDPEGRARLDVFVQALRQLGWTDGRNVRVDTRWAAGDTAQVRRHVAELVSLTPDVILATGTPVLTPLLKATRSVPIVFVVVIDPVGSGLVKSLAQPGGNATGFVMFEYSLAAKRLELLKEISPGVARVAVLRDPSISGGIGQFAAIQTVGSVGMELNAIDLQDAEQIERDIASFAHGRNDGLIVTASQYGANHPEVIIASAARHRLCAVYPLRYFVDAGGLISYGPNLLDQYRSGASYVDRILRGENPTFLPVQAPTKYELVVNLKSAKKIGIALPPTLLARADEVIE